MEKKFFLLIDSDLVYYYTDFFEEDGFLVGDGTNVYLYVDNRYIHAAKSDVKKGVIVREITDSLEKSLEEYISENNIKEIGVIYDSTSLNMYNLLKKNNVEVFDYTQKMNDITSIKTQEEIDRISTACKIAEKSYLETVEYLKSNLDNITESEVAAYLEYRFRVNGAEGPSFDTIVGFGENAAVPHHKTGNTKLKKNECILMDFGCKYKGYCSDITRTFFYGKPDDKFVEAYNLVLKAHLNAIENIKDGTTGIEADAFARDTLKAGGYGQYFTHSLGHGVGIKIHESPRLSPKSKNVLTNNMVFTDEPGVYLPGEFGIRIENTVTLQNGKCVSLVELDRDLKII